MLSITLPHTFWKYIAASNLLMKNNITNTSLRVSEVWLPNLSNPKFQLFLKKQEKLQVSVHEKNYTVYKNVLKKKCHHRENCVVKSKDVRALEALFL